jgi:hypothetical protein
MKCGEGERTEHLPCLAQPRLITSVEYEYDGVTFVVVPWPDGTDIALSTEVEEVECRGREGDLAD